MLIFRKYKAVILLIAIMLSFITFTVFNEPQQLQATPILVGIGVYEGIAILLAALGVYALNHDSLSSMIYDFWGNMTSGLQNEFLNSIDLNTRTLTVSDTLYNWAQQYISNTYVVGPNYHFIESQYVTTPWGGQVIKSLWDGNLSGLYTNISQDLWDSITHYSAINIPGYQIEYLDTGAYFYNYVNGLQANTNFTHDSYRYNDIYWNDSTYQENIHLKYSSSTYRFLDTGYGVNTFAYLYNPMQELLTPVICWYQSPEVIRVYSLFTRSSNNDTCFNWPVTVEGDYVYANVDGQAIDWEVDDVRELPIPYDASQVLGIEWADAINGVWTDNVYSDYTLPTETSFDWTRLSINAQLLTDKFPFSIPFDLSDALTSMQTTAVAPVFSDTLSMGGVVDVPIEFDFEVFQPIANIIKWGVLILFNIGLILITRRIIRG